mmetsp:Transcript_13920/g.28494  ORF Transcript_13920/g.28494 Transcript_13920/m.28494 type:complete len:199 (-) Transcript_13920:235-831(-)
MLFLSIGAPYSIAIFVKENVEHETNANATDGWKIQLDAARRTEWDHFPTGSVFGLAALASVVVHSVSDGGSRAPGEMRPSAKSLKMSNPTGQAPGPSKIFHPPELANLWEPKSVQKTLQHLRFHSGELTIEQPPLLSTEVIPGRKNRTPWFVAFLAIPLSQNATRDPEKTHPRANEQASLLSSSKPSPSDPSPNHFLR